jgi:hypothetical protein
MEKNHLYRLPAFPEIIVRNDRNNKKQSVKVVLTVSHGELLAHEVVVEESTVVE